MPPYMRRARLSPGVLRAVRLTIIPSALPYRRIEQAIRRAVQNSNRGDLARGPIFPLENVRSTSVTPRVGAFDYFER